MALGFFVDVLEVLSIREVKSRDPRIPVSHYARLRLSGGEVSIKIRDGINIAPGFSGKASGSLRIQLLKREFNGRFVDVIGFVPAELDTWIQGEAVRVQSSSSELQNFMGSNKK